MKDSFTIIGNFKQNGDADYVRQLVDALQSSDCSNYVKQQEIVLLPPVPYVSMTAAMISSPDIAVGVQMVSGRTGGAWTGCYHASMVAELGARYACIGHSERRMLCGEDDAQIAQQYIQAVGAGLRPILCIGETAKERESGQTLQVLERQLSAVFSADGFEKLPSHDTIIAYEPVWAIGAKHAASVDEVDAVFHGLRDQLKRYNAFTKVRLCYGGSVDETNCEQFMQSGSLTGLLVGRVCLDVYKFANLVKKCAAIRC